MAAVDAKGIAYSLTKTLYAALEDRAAQSDKKPVYNKDDWQYLGNFIQDERSQLKRKDVFKFNPDSIKFIVAMLRLYQKEIEAVAYEDGKTAYEYLEIIGDENDNGVADIMVRLRSHPLANIREGVLTKLTVDNKNYIEALLDAPIEKACKEAPSEVKLQLRSTFTNFLKAFCNVLSVKLWYEGSTTGTTTISTAWLKSQIAQLGVKEETLDAIDNEVEVIKTEKPPKKGGKTNKDDAAKK
ncbi:hypothetical protein D5b_00413 [Faustovirus]|nr:hypothetical protein D5b_00413 [Faustovirus]AMN84503.1 hypothetical protein D6_00092 [Faustovirus]AMP44355.1 hypothetical protein PRJ_Dakar_00404 [Faustovirus]QKE50199.1 hypothetical protein F-VV10_0079 [Faustovirus]